MIIKPVGLQSSKLVTAVFYRKELETALKNTFKKIDYLYEELDGRGVPQVLVEQLLDGPIYSFDVYINNEGKIFYGPPVSYVMARQIGIEDFFLHQQSSPVKLSESKLSEAHRVCEKAVRALNLKNSVAHIEIIETTEGWKVIEVGPRPGGYRQLIYGKVFKFNHIYNDILIKLGKNPNISTKPLGNISIIKFFAPKEGIVKSIKGLMKAKKLSSVFEADLIIKRGGLAQFAKHGGGPVAIVKLFNQDQAQFIEDKRRLQQMIDIEVE
jgi:hypothetical protein